MQQQKQSNTTKTLSVQNSIVSGMFLRAKTEVTETPFSILERDYEYSSQTTELVKSVAPWVPNYLLKRGPIIQSPDSALKPHPILEQPEYVDFNRTDALFCLKKHRSKEVYERALRRMDFLLKNDQARHDDESNGFELTTINDDHLSFIPHEKRHLNTTLGIRGTIAKKDLKAGTPLIYSAQFLNKAQWGAAIGVLGTYLESQLDLESDYATYDATRRLSSYAYRPHEFESETYYTPAYGAGNICSMINHDSEYENMASVYVPMLDAYKNPTAGVYMFFCHRDVKQGEQLLVNYGSQYNFEPVLTQRFLVETLPEDIDLTS